MIARSSADRTPRSRGADLEVLAVVLAVLVELLDALRPAGDVLVETRDVLREDRRVRLRLLDGGLELLNLGVAVSDGLRLLLRSALAELAVRRELHLLVLLGLLPLGHHVLHELDHFLDRRSAGAQFIS